MDIRSFFGGKKSSKNGVEGAAAPETVQPTQPTPGIRTTIRRTIDGQESESTGLLKAPRQGVVPMKPVDSPSFDSKATGKRRRLKKVLDSDSDEEDPDSQEPSPQSNNQREEANTVRSLLEEELGTAGGISADGKKSSGHLQLDIDFYTTKEKTIVDPLANVKPTKRENIDFDTYLSSFAIGAAKAKKPTNDAAGPSTNLTLAPKRDARDGSLPTLKEEETPSNITTQEPLGPSPLTTLDPDNPAQDLFSDNEPVPATPQSSPELSPVKKKQKAAASTNAASASTKAATSTKSAPNSNTDVAEMRFVFTGELEKIDRDTAVDLVRKLGGIYVSGISGKTNYLVCGEKLEDGRPFTDGTKYKKAAEMNKQKRADIRILNEQEFLKLIDYEKSKDLLFKLEDVVKPAASATSSPNEKRPQAEQYLPFCEKYRPSNLHDVIGNEDNVRKLVEWLRNWSPGKGQICALLSGPPGVGKTTTAKLAAAVCGYECVEFNASDLRNKSAVEHISMLATGGQSFSFSGKCKVKRTLVLLDEVDGMGGGDRGGLQAVVALLPRAMSPIICICNDRHNQKITTLGNKSMDIRFSAPSLAQFSQRVLAVCAAEGISLPPDTIPQLYEQSGGDFRYVLNAIEFNSAKGSLGNEMDSARNDKKDMGNTKNIFEATGRLFSIRSAEGEQRIKDIQQVFFIDYNIMPLMVQENYVKYLQNKRTSLPLLVKLSGTLVQADIVEERLKQRQEFSLLPDLAVLSTIVPAVEILKTKGFCRERLMFPQFLGRYSSTAKNRRFLGEIGKHLGSRSMVRSSALVTDGYLNLMYTKIMRELASGDVVAAADMVEELGLTRELLVDALPSLRLKSQENLYEKIETKKKTALTKRLNEQSAKVAPVKRKRETALRIVDEEAELSSAGSDSDSAESDTGLVKLNTKPAKKRTAAKTGSRAAKK